MKLAMFRQALYDITTLQCVPEFCWYDAAYDRTEGSTLSHFGGDEGMEQLTYQAGVLLTALQEEQLICTTLDVSSDEAVALVDRGGIDVGRRDEGEGVAGSIESKAARSMDSQADEHQKSVPSSQAAGDIEPEVAGRVEPQVEESEEEEYDYLEHCAEYEDVYVCSGCPKCIPRAAKAADLLPSIAEEVLDESDSRVDEHHTSVPSPGVAGDIDSKVAASIDSRVASSKVAGDIDSRVADCIYSQVLQKQQNRRNNSVSALSRGLPVYGKRWRRPEKVRFLGEEWWLQIVAFAQVSVSSSSVVSDLLIFEEPEEEEDFATFSCQEVGSSLLRAWESASSQAREILADRWHLQYEETVPKALTELLLAGCTGREHEAAMEMMQAMYARAETSTKSLFNKEKRRREMDSRMQREIDSQKDPDLRAFMQSEHDRSRSQKHS